MHDDVINRLASLGYTVEAADEWVVNYLIEKVTKTVKNECNTLSIPEGLHHVAVDMVCGELLMMKKASGQLDDFDAEAAVKQISEGDTSITYEIPTSTITLDALITMLMDYDQSQFLTYRRVRW